MDIPPLLTQLFSPTSQVFAGHNFWLISIFFCLVLFITFLIRGLNHLKRGNLWRFSKNLVFSIFAGMLCVLICTLLLNLTTYQRLVHEKEVARIHFQKLAPQHYLASIQYPGTTEVHTYSLYGDAFQIDAQILKWHGFANLLGMDALYRLYRLSGRYENIEQERNSLRSVHALYLESETFDLWKLGDEYEKWLPWVDALYGSAAISHITPAVEYRIFVTQSGLLVRQRYTGSAS